MTKLSAAQADMLATAQASPGGIVAKDTGHRRVTGALIKRGFLVAEEASDGPSRLKLTDAGRAAIGQPASTAEPSARPPGKTQRLITLMLRPEGATLADMIEVTGWQPHSVRGAIAGAIKKDLGHNVLSEKAEGERVYRIVAQGSA